MHGHEASLTAQPGVGREDMVRQLPGNCLDAQLVVEGLARAGGQAALGVYCFVLEEGQLSHAHNAGVASCTASGRSPS